MQAQSSQLESVRETRGIARINAPKSLFLLAAGLSFVASVSLWFLADREQGLFVGLWVPSILALGALMMSGNGDRS